MHCLSVFECIDLLFFLFCFFLGFVIPCLGTPTLITKTKNKKQQKNQQHNGSLKPNIDDLIESDDPIVYLLVGIWERKHLTP